MTPIEFTRDHYPTVAQWWADHNWPVLSMEQLPKTGIIITGNEKLYCAGWLYSTDSQLSLLEWVVSNPDTTFDERSEALDLLFKSILEKAKPGDIVCGFSNKPSLTRRYEKFGFKLGDENMNFLIKPIIGGN